MQATVTHLRQEIRVISDKEEVQAGLDGHLTLDQQKILCVRGGSTPALIGQIYSEFARHLDHDGKPFYFSRKFRGMVHSDPLWKSIKKVDGQALAAYLLEWFVPVTKITNNDGDALVIVNELPVFFTALVLQSRNINQQISQLLDWID
jgi:hypothetical protein